MDFAKYFIKNSTTSWLVIAILIIGGIVSFLNVGRLEDPQFTIKQALIITNYPGASPQQVEEEVTLPLEEALQRLPYLKNVKSTSSSGLSQITVEMKSIYRKKELEQIWDELRRRILDVYVRFPPGVSEPLIRDDFGDVFGVLLSISGDNYTDKDLSNFADFLKRELITVNGVGKVDIQGERNEIVVVEISRSKLASLGISLDRLSQILNTQNTVSDAGSIALNSERIRFYSSGEFQSIEELNRLIISSPNNPNLIYLGDVANVSRVYSEMPSNITRYNGNNALLLGVSFGPGVNVVDVGALITQKLDELKAYQPIGLDIDVIYNQPVEVENSVNDFLFNLVSAVAIVIIVLFFSMGWQAGTIIGLVLFMTVMGTFIFMLEMGIELQRISLGALIIALGMLVDNAIVITEGIMSGQKRRLTIVEAASLIVKQTQWPLLGATIIAITAFAPIGLSSDATGEFAGSLYWVLLISLFLSWITAITITPFLASLFFKDNDNQEQNQKVEVEEKNGVIIAILNFALKYRAVFYTATLASLIAAVVGFSQVKQAFFPPATTPMFLIDVWHKQGTDIVYNSEAIKDIEREVMSFNGTEQVTTTVGRGALRFMLTYQATNLYSAYSQMIVRMDNLENVEQGIFSLREYMDNNHSDVFYKVKRLEIGPSTDAKIEVRISGPEPDVLRVQADKVKAILEQVDFARNIRDDWRQQVKVIRPIINEAAARRVGVSKSDVDQLLKASFEGANFGLYRDGSDLLPIVVRLPDEERLSIDSLFDLQIFSRANQRYIPITQVVDDFEIIWEDPIIARRDRKRSLVVTADHDIMGERTANDLLQIVKPQIDQLDLPAGYSIDWGGEYEAANDAQKAVFAGLPIGYLIMFIITVLLFNSFRAGLAIWASVPLAVIGVTLGMLVAGAPFGFMALLGLLSLTGMMVKNGIVLVEQINIELKAGKAPYDAVVEATKSRVRPVSMAALTTVLGMIPLIADDFFFSMAIVIMAGLGVATVLTLVVVPLVYCSIFKISTPKG
ncbi:efflux RND transporter permease subunit [Endozoicomonas sp. G2_1]|uniref:efflux RND transporter permease subunit n=1 Tax=Endozoicomonas sp. G2_1 TaxID=2821091 RepID=UPI001ADB1A0F|nr:efflux RND transporter permease subunit [Endozoicomonas sp. G2_1]MBO9490377.1 efflux RND transporter permease subunit [Endozoicomonas sp. G2_1]